MFSDSRILDNIGAPLRDGLHNDDEDHVNDGTESLSEMTSPWRNDGEGHKVQTVPSSDVEKVIPSSSEAHAEEMVVL